MNEVKTLFKKADNEAGFIRAMVNDKDSYDYFVASGWGENLSQLSHNNDDESMSEEERELRDTCEQLTGKKIGGRAKLGTIKKMVLEAQGNADN